MTDEAYTLMETNRDRAIVKNSAFKRVTGRHTNGGNFGVEGKSQAELNALNGPVMSMNPRTFYTWSEFKALAPNLQVEYLEKLVFRYDIGLETIAQEQFHLKNGSVITKHMKRHIDPNYKAPNKSGFKVSPAGKKKYMDDLAAAWFLTTAEAPAAEPEKEEKNTVETTTETTTTTTDIHMNIRMTGLDMGMLNALHEMLRNYPNIPVNIVIGGN